MISATKTDSKNSNSKAAAESARSKATDEKDRNENSSPDLVGVQTKLAVGKPGDKYEREADHVADKVISTPAVNYVQRKCKACADEEKQLQKKPSNQISPWVQKQTEEQNKIESDTIQKHSSSPGSSSPGHSFESSLNNSKGGGGALPEDTRSFMETRIGADFSDVKVHTDSNAVQMNRELNAQAFTNGSDIYFNEGKFNPGSESGKRLLAHELTHTIQQGAVRRKPEAEGSTPDIQAFFFNKDEKSEDKCKKKDKKKGSKQQAKQKETSKSEDKCPTSNPKGEKPPKDKEKPEKEEKPVAVGARAGASVKDRQKNAPAAKKTTHNVPANATDQAAEKQLGPCVLKKVAKKEAGSGKGPKKKSAVSKAAGVVKKGKKSDTVKQDKSKKGKEGKEEGEKAKIGGVGEAASPKLLLEREAQKVSAAGSATALMGRRLTLEELHGQNTEFLQPDLGSDPNLEALAKARARHAESSALANDYITSSAARLNGFIGQSLNKAEQIKINTQGRKAEIQGKIESRKQQARANIAQLKGKSQAKAQAAKMQIRAKHKRVVAQIETKAMAARQKVLQEHIQNEKLLIQKRAAQLGKLDTIYTNAESDIRKIGTRMGTYAMTKAETRASDYETAKGENDEIRKLVGPPKRKDGFWDGYLTHNRYMARAKSAREMGKQYRDGMVEEANSQADIVICDKPQDVKKVNVVADQTKESLQCTYDNAMESIETHRSNSLKNAGQMKRQMLDAINSTLRVTMGQLSDQERAQVQFLNDYGIRQVMAVERDAENAAASLLKGTDEGVGQLMDSLFAFRESVVTSDAPEPVKVQEGIEQLKGEFDLSMSNMDGVSWSTMAATEQSLILGGAHTLGALDKYADQEIESSRVTTDTFIEKIDSALNQAISGLDQILTGCNKQINSALVTATSTFSSVITGLDGLYANHNAQISKRIGNNKKNIEGGMRDSIEKDLDNKISCEAEKAANEVQPWWKDVLKVLLVIVVIVVMIVVLGPAGGLLATVVQGAVAGAVAGAVIQIGNNLIDGKKWSDGVVDAIIIGAIGGALGGAGGHFAKGLFKAVEGGLSVSQHIIKGGVELAFDAVGGVLGDLAVGNPITWQGILLGAGIGLGVNVGVGGFGFVKGKISGAIKRKPKVGADVPTTKPGAETGSPKVKAQPSTPKADSDAGTTGSRPTKEHKQNLDQSKGKKLKEMNDQELHSELKEAGKNKPKVVEDPKLTKEYDVEIEANGHTYRRRKDGKGWCRFSAKECGIPDADLPKSVQDNVPKKTKKHRDFEDEIQRRENLGEKDGGIDADTAKKLREYSVSTKNGPTRNIDEVIKDIKAKKDFNPKTSRFSEKSAKKIDIKAVEVKKQKLEHSVINNKEVTIHVRDANGKIVKDAKGVPMKKKLTAKEAFEELNKLRSKHKKIKDSAWSKKSKKYKQAEQRMREASEEMGNVATDVAYKQQMPNAKELHAELPGGQKSGEFDKIVKNGDEIYIFESKGGGSQRGSRKTIEGKRAEQGTPEYRDDIIVNMQENVRTHKRSERYKNDPDFKKEIDDLRLTLIELKRARRRGKLKFMQVSQRLETSGSNKGNLKNEIEITEFSNEYAKND